MATVRSSVNFSCHVDGQALVGVANMDYDVRAETVEAIRLAVVAAGGTLKIGPPELDAQGVAGTSSSVVASIQGVSGGVPLAVSEPGLSGGILQSVTTVGATAVPLPATPLAGRSVMLVQASPTNTANIYLGASTVTADTAATGGIMLLPGQSIPISLAAAVILYARSTVASQLVRVLEVAA